MAEEGRDQGNEVGDSAQTGTAPPSPWEDPFPADVKHLDSQADWDKLRADYARGSEDRPIDRCLKVVKGHDARRAVIETRYIDPDYRSEYTAYYSRAFANYPDNAHRIHFFKSTAIERTNLADLPDNPGYLGYMVIRPRVAGPVGRTVLLPPSELVSSIRTSIEETVTFFGQQLTVRGVPFVQQDGQLGRCAHAAAWVCHYSAHRRGEVARRTTAFFSMSTDPSLAVGRPLPSEGLTVSQVCELLRLAELPAKYYSLKRPTDADRPSWWKPKVRNTVEARVARICRRYLDSGFPVFVTAQEQNSTGPSPQKHAFVVCGYKRLPTGSFHLIVNDDQRGPYIEIDSVRAGRSTVDDLQFEWECILAPLPEKLWMTGEAAERWGSSLLVNAAVDARNEGIVEAGYLVERFDAGRLRIQTYAIRNNDFKRKARERFCDDIAVLDAYSYVRLSRYVWVVEAVDLDERLRSESGDPVPYVIGEIVIDATSGKDDPIVLATRLPGVISFRIDNDRTQTNLTGAETHRHGGA